MVEILLATYNGEKYLQKQLDSIKNQTYKNWTLKIVDDCSLDRTKEILENFKKENPLNDIEIYYNKINEGHCLTFFKLLEASKGEIIFFCDQDDIWYPKKIQRALNIVKEKQNAILYHTDQKVIDAQERIIFNSSMERLKNSFIKFDLIDYISSNNVTGCTICINKKLKEKILKLDKQVIKKIRYHDWAFAIIAKLYGEIYYDNFISMDYRLHLENASIKIKRNKFEKLCNIKKRIKSKVSTYNQFYEILNYYKTKEELKTNTEVEKILNDIKNYSSKNYYQRLKFNYKFGNWKKIKNNLKKMLFLLES